MSSLRGSHTVSRHTIQADGTPSTKAAAAARATPRGRQRQRMPASSAAAAVGRSPSQHQDLQTLDLPPPPPPLKPLPIIHTTAYLQQTQQLVVPQIASSTEEDDLQQRQADLDSNALVWALKKVDDQLNMVEQQPSEIHQAIYDFSNGPVGQATSKGVQVAAKLTMTATIEAAKVAAPVGKWALQQGFKAAVGLVGAAIQQGSKQKQQEKKRKVDAKASSSKAGKRR